MQLNPSNVHRRARQLKQVGSSPDAGPRNQLAVITTTLTAWAVKLPMVPLEAGFLGWKFSSAGMTFTLVASVLMGSLMGRLMRDKAEAAQRRSI